MNCWLCKKETTGKDFCSHCGAPLGEILQLTQDEGDAVAKVKISNADVYLVIFDEGERKVLKMVS